MTIHSDWSRLLHSECPEAFAKQPPKKDNHVGFVDGHLQLMRLHPQVGSWANFIKYQFVKPLKMLLDAGCPRVVLCFDCYDNVPLYKNMTQVSRVNRHQVRPFAEGQELPESIPDDPMSYLMNRRFKLKIIEMLCKQVPIMLKLNVGQTLMIDYHCVVEYVGGQCPMIPLPVDGMHPMGESDVKFARYVDRYGNGLIHAIDGDYMAIALMYYTHNSPDRAKNRMHIYRQLAVQKTSECKKRKADDVPRARATTPMCWVDMQLIFHVISGAMRQSISGDLLCPVTQAGYTDQERVRAAVLLIILAGTDFSRCLPLLGPKRLWECLPCITPALLAGTATDSDRTIMDGVVAAAYKEVFEKHSGAGRSFEIVMRNLACSKLAPSTKDKFPDARKILCTLRNARWVMQYWSAINTSVPTPLDGENGYVENRAEGGVIFADAVLA